MVSARKQSPTLCWPVSDFQLARLRGFEPDTSGPLFAFEPEPYRPQAIDARIRFVAASRVEAAQELQSRTYSESAKTG